MSHRRTHFLHQEKRDCVNTVLVKAHGEGENSNAASIIGLQGLRMIHTTIEIDCRSVLGLLISLATQMTRVFLWPVYSRLITLPRCCITSQDLEIDQGKKLYSNRPQVCLFRHPYTAPF